MSEPRVISFPAAQSVSDQTISREAEGDGAAVTLGSSRVGEQLRLAREARNLSLGEAAQSLKLAPRQVEALESENWGALPGNTMIRGFVRNYARLLNLDADVLMRALDAAQLQQAPQLEASAGTSASLPQASSRRVERRDWLAVLAGLLLLGLAGLAYFFVPADLWRAQLTSLVEDGKSASMTGAGTPSSAGEPAPAAGGSVTRPHAAGEPSRRPVGDRAAAWQRAQAFLCRACLGRDPRRSRPDTPLRVEPGRQCARDRRAAAVCAGGRQLDACDRAVPGQGD
jgi:transcriptional regulator with XRE-family HTH domain